MFKAVASLISGNDKEESNSNNNVESSTDDDNRKKEKEKENEEPSRVSKAEAEVEATEPLSLSTDTKKNDIQDDKVREAADDNKKKDDDDDLVMKTTATTLSSVSVSVEANETADELVMQSSKTQSEESNKVNEADENKTTTDTTSTQSHDVKDSKKKTLLNNSNNNNNNNKNRKRKKSEKSEREDSSSSISSSSQQNKNSKKKHHKENKTSTKKSNTKKGSSTNTTTSSTTNVETIDSSIIQASNSFIHNLHAILREVCSTDIILPFLTTSTSSSKSTGDTANNTTSTSSSNNNNNNISSSSSSSNVKILPNTSNEFMDCLNHASFSHAHHPSLPSIAQVKATSIKSIHQNPPWVHLSQRDSAQQLKIDDSLPNLNYLDKELSTQQQDDDKDNNTNNMKVLQNPYATGRRLTVKGGMRGYRMSRASHAVSPSSSSSQAQSKAQQAKAITTKKGNNDKTSSSTWYYEIVVMEPPCAKEIIQNLPSHVRLGDKLQEQLKEKILYEKSLEKKKEKKNESHKSTTTTTTTTTTNNNNTLDQQNKIEFHKQKQMLGGNLRMGWSKRTGELQAPVGYDQWSYGIRDLFCSRIHDSKRRDKWDNRGIIQSIGPGDVVGVLIHFDASSDSDDNGDYLDTDAHGDKGKYNKYNSYSEMDTTSSTTANNKNTIHFFKNGQSLGQIMVSRNSRSGGEAFTNVKPGSYYPAISLYMGGCARVNFGPHFIYNIQPSQLPTHLLPKKDIQPICDLSEKPKTPQEMVDYAMQKKETLFPMKQQTLWFGKENSSASSSTGTGTGTSDGTSNNNNNNKNSPQFENSKILLHVFKEIVRQDAKIRHDAYLKHLDCHYEEIRKARELRGLGVNDIPPSSTRMKKMEEKKNEIEKENLQSTSGDGENMDMDGNA